MRASTWRIRPARSEDRDFVPQLTPRLTQGFPLPPGRTAEEVVQAGAEWEGQGAGRALLDAAEGWARSQGVEMITLHVFVGNERARAVYERQGYAAETLRYVKWL